jgi:P pilus assembly chaperone PapD
MKFTKSLLLLSLLSCSALSSELTLDVSQILFENNEKTKRVVKVNNVNPETPVYVDVIVNEVLQPELGTKSKLKRHNQPADAGIYVSPGKMVIKKGVDFQPMSIVNINQNLEKERVYRIDVRPVASGLQSHQSMAIKVLLAYDVLVHVQPEKPFIEASHYYTDKSLVIKNTGNARFFVANGKVCNEADECFDAPSGFIYSGAEGAVPMPDDVSYVTYDLVMVGQKTKNITFKR